MRVVAVARSFSLDATSRIEPAINALDAKVAFDRFVVGRDFVAAARLAAKLTNGSNAFEDVQHEEIPIVFE